MASPFDRPVTIRQGKSSICDHGRLDCSPNKYLDCGLPKFLLNDVYELILSRERQVCNARESSIKA